MSTAYYDTNGNVAVIRLDNPPVNALTVQGWYDVADALRAAGKNPEVCVVVLRAEGRGFNVHKYRVFRKAFGDCSSNLSPKIVINR